MHFAITQERDHLSYLENVSMCVCVLGERHLSNNMSNLCKTENTNNLGALNLCRALFYLFTGMKFSIYTHKSMRRLSFSYHHHHYIHFTGKETETQ